MKLKVAIFIVFFCSLQIGNEVGHHHAAGQGFEQHLDDVYHTGVSWRARAQPFAVQRDPSGPISQRYVDLVYQPYRDRYGTTIGIFVQGYDVTDAVEAQAARVEADARLKAGSYRLELRDFYNMSYLQSNTTYSDAGGVQGPSNRFDIHGLRIMPMP